ncbi:MAG TPA: formate dehydrogenase accessory sulfurtransferase FdhD [Thermoanaerobaculia bacterium]|nr:formate dehydrogenase accessory sulfurtransferase FdhD [Thermoanaerobaculia bacterium]
MKSTSTIEITRIEGATTWNATDVLAVEEPLEIRIAWILASVTTEKSISITMRTPGTDPDLAAGFLFTEGIVRSPAEISSIRHCGRQGSSSDDRNVIRVELSDGVSIDWKRLERHFYTSSSCGVCGKTSIEALAVTATPLREGPSATIDSILTMPLALQKEQSIFSQTGGLHAAGLFSGEGKLIAIREDVGRHNAVDKVIGAQFLEGATPLSGAILMVSGRASFELVQKALVAGIPILAAVGAPSSLAVELAAEYGMTLIGFLRDDRMNVYCGRERVTVGR